MHCTSSPYKPYKRPLKLSFVPNGENVEKAAAQGLLR